MRTETRSFYESAVHRAAEQVTADLDRALDLEQLARAAALSPFHFHRVFRGMVGETPLELHRRLRMERAAWTLAHTDDPVTEIAFSAGYETHESFTRAFRLHYLCSPSEFRENRLAEHAACERPFQVELPARSGIHFAADSRSGRTLPAHGEALISFPFIEGETAMKVEIKEMPELRVATVAHVGPYHRISEAFARLGDIAGPARLFAPGAAMLAIYHDDPETTPAAELRSEAGITVGPSVKLPEGLGERTLPAGRYACTVHIGPYEEMGDVWARLIGQWLPKSGERMRDSVSYEIYRNTPADVPKEKLQTELYIPLA
jgi:AraC family transcriptional regulator